MIEQAGPIFEQGEVLFKLKLVVGDEFTKVGAFEVFAEIKEAM